MTPRYVAPELARAWRKAVREEGTACRELAERDGWHESTVTAHVYGAQAPPDERVPSPHANETDWTPHYPDADEIWKHRVDRGWLAWSEVTGVPPSRLSDAMRVRGWACHPSGHPPKIRKAPCRGCERKQIPVEELSEDRLCADCDPGGDAEARKLRELVARERKKYLDRTGQ